MEIQIARGSQKAPPWRNNGTNPVTVVKVVVRM
jgi:hypothetical protein